MKRHQLPDNKLGIVFATAISGNDILSSIFYVSGIAIIYAGVFSPLVLMSIAFVLYIFQTVYREVVEAIPVNGGAYNALLNGTSKTIASTAGIMTILSYTATSVISAKTAISYLLSFFNNFFSQIFLFNNLNTDIFIIPLAILILLIFALIVLKGLHDSAEVALVIFLFHIIALCIFIAIGLAYVASHGLMIFRINMDSTAIIVREHGGIIATMFLAFSTSLLSAAGFESSANFVEEQKKGVYRYTLKNMIIAVLIFNPIIAFLILATVPIDTVRSVKDFILAFNAQGTGGLFLNGLISVDAFLVLCGAVLTSFISISGLMHRMASDECLPQFLLKENKRQAYPRIILLFLLLCSSILLITHGNLLSLAGVYTISFLGVMVLFAFGNLILRQTRRELKRPYRAPFLYVLVALIATSAGVIGNILINPANISYFLLYFLPACFISLGIIYKRDWIATLMHFTKPFPIWHKKLGKMYRKIIHRRYYVFINHENKLYTILNYIDRNENGYNITLLHCKEDEGKERENIADLIPRLKEAGAFQDFNISYEYIDEPFTPEVIENFVQENRIHRNAVFIGSIHDFHKFDYSDLGVVRIIS